MRNRLIYFSVRLKPDTPYCCGAGAGAGAGVAGAALGPWCLPPALLPVPESWSSLPAPVPPWVAVRRSTRPTSHRRG